MCRCCGIFWCVGLCCCVLWEACLSYPFTSPGLKGCPRKYSRTSFSLPVMYLPSLQLFFFLKNIPSLSISACCPALSTLFPCSQSGKWEIRKQLPSYFTSEVLPYFHKLSFVFAGVWKTRPDHPPPPNPRRAESTVGLIILQCSSTCCFY